MTALLIGTVLALGALAFVLFPLFTDDPTGGRESTSGRGRAIVPEDPVSALREIEFDRATGKLSDTDYAELKASYTRDAIDAMRSSDNREAERAVRPAATAAGGMLAVDDPAEAAILRYRVRGSDCPSCGPRPESDAAFCSDCGRFLGGSCAGCGAPATEAGARFCTNCGKTLAA
jgi:hypothetical protein